jgi:hypothetical protein
MQRQTTFANMISSNMYILYQAIDAYLGFPSMWEVEGGPFLKPASAIQNTPC